MIGFCRRGNVYFSIFFLLTVKLGKRLGWALLGETGHKK